MALKPAILHECFLALEDHAEWFTNGEEELAFLRQQVSEKLSGQRLMLLKVLVFLVEKVARHAEASQMTAKNLAICLAPCFLRTEGAEEQVRTRMLACTAFEVIIARRMELFDK